MGDEQKFSAPESERLIALGFAEDAPVYSIGNPHFGLTDVRVALFHSTYQRPITLPLLSGREEGVRLAVIPELIQATHYVTDGAIGHSDLPHWYVRGHLPRSGFTPEQSLCTVHMELILARIDDPDQVETVNYQLVADPPADLPSRQLVRATGEPLL